MYLNFVQINHSRKGRKRLRQGFSLVGLYNSCLLNLTRDCLSDICPRPSLYLVYRISKNVKNKDTVVDHRTRINIFFRQNQNNLLVVYDR